MRESAIKREGESEREARKATRRWQRESKLHTEQGKGRQRDCDESHMRRKIIKTAATKTGAVWSDAVVNYSIASASRRLQQGVDGMDLF